MAQRFWLAIGKMLLMVLSIAGSASIFILFVKTIYDAWPMSAPAAGVFGGAFAAAIVLYIAWKVRA